MGSTVPSKDEGYDSVRNSTDISSHGTIPKWLEEISEKIEQSHNEGKSNGVRGAFDVKNYFDCVDRPIRRNSESAKYGRRSSLSSQPSEDDPATPSHPNVGYRIPRFDGKFDLKSLHPDPYQLDLERSWKSLDNFKQSHKGRLDSAKNLDLEPKIGDYDSVLSPISSSDENFGSEISTIYSPSLLEEQVPNRSRSEMCNYHEKKFPAGSKRYDPIFEKKLNEYQLKIDKENKLREEIICELLAENERITERLRRHSMERGEPEGYRKYNSNSKYKSKSSKKSKERRESIFIIPELPTGQTLIIDILSTWGDRYYVGLNGIEIFGVDGKLVPVKKITAVPPDVNVLPECYNDPRIVSNLLDGVNRTQDDMHIWLAPFENGCSHIITIEFEEVSTLSMIRIWNYNKSRIHSYRGVRDVVMFLDDTPIFKGEIAKACGGILGGIHAFGDTILFTTEDQILENIARNDPSYSFLTSGPSTPAITERPPTSALTSDIRPVTGPVAKSSPTDQILLGASQIELVLLSNWGHSTMVGLTGFELVQGNDTVIPVKPNQLSCSAKNENAALAKLIDGINITNEETNMWWVPYEFGEEVTVRMDFEDFKYVSGIRIWNYNGNLEVSYAGVRAMKILLDGKPVKNPLTKNEIFILRRAPGNRYYDYVQDLRFIEDLEENQEIPSLLDQDEFYEPSAMPEGFVFQFIIFSSWDDQYYCGLNGLELYNQYGKKIILDEQNICAYPESVNSLPNVVGDMRTPNKLIDGVNDDHMGSHSWLAPIIPKHLNRIYIVLDQPIVVSLVKLWNYSKTPSRGVKEFGILVDDLLVYNGTLEKYSASIGGYQSVVFTENETILGEEYDDIMKNGAFSQDVVLLDEDVRTTTGGSLPEADPALRPFTSVNLYDRVYTSISR